MGWIVTVLMVVQVLCALSIIILVLLQHGKGADMGAAFGSGASGSLFGASGSANFLSRTTAIAAGIFFVATIGMAYTATSARTARGGGLMTTSTPAPATPAAPAGAAPQIPQDSGTPAPTGAPKSATDAAPAKPADKSSEIPK